MSKQKNIVFWEQFVFHSGKKITVTANFLVLMLKCLKFNCFMLQDQTIKSLVLPKYPHSDPSSR